tara:strand:+ start:277 stop:576 length:300 start_codon:yes stop_codon:yes gene_type:complete
VEGWAEIAERFGLPVVMLMGMSWGAVHLFKWLANDLMRQLQDNASRIEAIVIKLIDNSKKERAEHREESKVRDQQMTTLIDLMVKLTGNGLSGTKNRKD